VLHLRLIILSVRDGVPIDSETLLMIDFMNLKIKPASFRYAHRGRLYVLVFIRVSTYIYMSICVCTVLKKEFLK
jgi:hypothetical protein